MSSKGKAPNFQAVDSNGNEVALSDFLGRYVLLVFNRGFV